MNVKETLLAGLGWLKGRNLLTLAVGYGVGALSDDLLIGLVKAGLSLF